MRNCLILGSGRSGTSLVAGVLAKSGYFMGDQLHAARDGNPKGFFEDVEINNLNEALLARAIFTRPSPHRITNHLLRHIPVEGQLWMGRLPVRKTVRNTPETEARIRHILAQEPYCYKDPRFSYTLPAWRPFLATDTAFVCVFREPAATARSMVKECRENYDLKLSFEGALRVWELMYAHILEKHRHEGDWLFLHYDQVLDGSGLDRLSAFTGAAVDRSFVDARLKRSSSEGRVPASVSRTYDTLCRLAQVDAPALLEAA